MPMTASNSVPGSSEVQRSASGSVLLKPLIAPVSRAQRVGTVKVALDGRPVADFALIALEDVPLASLFGRAWDTVRLWFRKD